MKAYPSDIVSFVILVSQPMLTGPGVLSLFMLRVVGDHSVEEVLGRSWRVDDALVHHTSLYMCVPLPNRLIKCVRTGTNHRACLFMPHIKITRTF